jgi:hypothetical protein
MSRASISKDPILVWLFILAEVIFNVFLHLRDPFREAVFRYMPRYLMVFQKQHLLWFPLPDT